MKMKLFMLCMLAVLVFAVGCSNSAEADDVETVAGYGVNSSNPSNSNPTTTSTPRGADSNDYVVARVNGMDIYASEVNIHIAQAENMLLWDFFMMTGEFEMDHEAEFAPGVTFGRAIREEAVRIAAFTKIYEEYAHRLGITLNDEQQQLIDDEIEHLREHFGEEEFYVLLHEDGFRNSYHLAELFASQFLLNNLVEAVVEMPAEFLRFESYMPPEETAENLLGAAHILASFSEFATQADAEVFAQGLLDRVLAGEDFNTLAHEYSQDPGIETFPNGYTFTFGDMVPEFEQATLELEIGGISGLVFTNFGIHIIQRTEPNLDDFHLMNQTQPRTLQDRMMEAVFLGLEAMVYDAELEFLPAL